MDLGIRGKTALVTAGGRGIGRSIADSLVKEGVRVAIVARTQADLDDFVATHGNSNLGIVCDLEKDDAPAFLISQLLEQFTSPDIIVHNLGGTLDLTDPFCSVSDWRRVYRLNLEVGVELNRALVPEMQRRRWGRVVHISSIASLENQGPVPYCAMKAALNAYVRSFGRFVAPDGVCISTLLPGAVFTHDGYWDTASRERPDHVRKYLDERMAIRRFGTTEEIGAMATFLCSQHASFIVGSAILVDGGQGRAFQYE